MPAKLLTKCVGVGNEFLRRLGRLMAKYLISAGHGAGDPGNTANGRREADICLELRDIVALKLRQLGHDVITDGRAKENWALTKAMQLIGLGRTSIELHTNAASDPLARGVETVAKPKDKALAQRISAAIASTLGTVTRREGGFMDGATVKKERGFYPGFVRAGGLIVEVSFQSNKQELAAFDARKWLVATAIVKALTEVAA